MYVGQPLDTVKVKMQTFPSVYQNGLKCFVQTFKQDGLWKGLYAGEGISNMMTKIVLSVIRI